MKRFLSCFALAYTFSSCLFAFEFSPFYTGLRLEANMNSYEFVSAGFGVETLYSISQGIKVGGSCIFSSDFNMFNTLELLFDCGYLFPAAFWNGRGRLMLGGTVGYQQIWHDAAASHVVSAGLQGRLLFRLDKNEASQLFLVPVLRLGYPYLWSAGVSCGVVFL